MSNTHKIYSTVNEPKRENIKNHEYIVEFNDVAKEIESVLLENDIKVHAYELDTDTFFLLMLFDIHGDVNPQDILRLKETLKVKLNKPYMNIYYPSEGRVGIRVPCPTPKDPLFQYKYSSLTRKDFQFIDTFLHVILAQTVDVQSLCLVIDATEDEIKDILVDMINIGLITESGIVTQTEYLCSKYWIKWKEMIFEELIDRSELNKAIKKSKKDSKRALIRRVQTGKTDPYVIICDNRVKEGKDTGKFIDTLGFKNIVCKTPDQVFDALSKYRCNLLITDLILTGMDGFEMMNILRNNYLLKLPIIVLTNMTNENYIKEAMKYDIQEYLVKTDIDYNSLEEIVGKYI